ncbi:MAG: GNAT family N-acetyltransferase [Ruminococcaceae bacterium]|nr:GNAT family N-acetyltransferase [Oscillospiraceae bacterium]
MIAIAQRIDFMSENIFKIIEMTEDIAREISCWKYDGEYAMYSFDGDEEEFRQVMNGLHLPAVFCDSGELAGFIAVGPAGQVLNKKSAVIYADESFTDFALGLRPDLCGLGKGYGESLLNACMSFLKAEFPEDGLRLTVASNNNRAKRVYEKNGFKTVFEFRKFTGTPEGRKLIKYEIMQL